MFLPLFLFQLLVPPESELLDELGLALINQVRFLHDVHLHGDIVKLLKDTYYHNDVMVVIVI